MPETMSPREKVAAAVREASRGQWSDGVRVGSAKWCNHLTDAILAALASSGDHAELARLADRATHRSWSAFTDDTGPRPHTNLVSFTPITDCALSIPGVHKNDPNIAFIAAASPANVLSLIAEVAALRGAKWEVQHADTMNDMVLMGMARDDAEARATEAEHKLAEVLQAIYERLPCDHSLRDFLSKEAERG